MFLTGVIVDGNFDLPSVTESSWIIFDNAFPIFILWKRNKSVVIFRIVRKTLRTTSTKPNVKNNEIGNQGRKLVEMELHENTTAENSWQVTANLLSHAKC